MKKKEYYIYIYFAITNQRKNIKENKIIFQIMKTFFF
jgi:hypothetical protein